VPFTGVGKASVAQVQEVLNMSPKGIPVPALKPITQNDTINVAQTGLVGNWSFYNKQPGLTVYAPYPIELNSMHTIFSENKNVLNKPYLFSIGEASIQVNDYTGNSLLVIVTANRNDGLVLQQNYFKHWYYYDNKGRSAVGNYNDIFITAPVDSGEHKIRFSFEPTVIRVLMFASAAIFCLFTILAFFLHYRKNPVTK
jgi:uncharacterized membrane protein YfhO